MPKPNAKSKLNGSVDTFANALRDMIAEAVDYGKESIINPVMDLIVETKSEFQVEIGTLGENMNAQFRAQDKAHKQLSKEVKQLSEEVKQQK